MSIVPSYEGSASVSFILKLIRAALRSSLLAKLPLSILYSLYMCVLGIIMINILWVTYQVGTIPTRLKEEKEKDSHRVSGTQTQLFHL